MIHPSIVKSGNGVISIFNNANQGQQEEYVAGGILYLSDSIILISSKFKAFIGTSSNKFDQNKGTKFFVNNSSRGKVTEFKVFGDSFITNWLNCSFRMEELFSQPILE